MRLAALVVFTALAWSGPAYAQTSATAPGEEEVDPYVISDANAGAIPFSGKEMFEAFHGHEGVSRIVDDLVERVQADARLWDIFKASDFIRLRRTLKEQFCYILGGGCAYTGRDMKLVHADHGITTAEFNALVECLQDAMKREGIPFGVQNRFLAKLAPMRRDAVTR